MRKEKLSTEHVSILPLSAAIVAHLQRTGLTLKEIGSLIGVSESFISYVKKGKRNLTIFHLSKLEKSLKQPLPSLLLQVMSEELIPSELRSQYKALSEVLSHSEELGRTLGHIA